MAFDIGPIVVGINVLVGILIFVMTLITMHRLKGSVFRWVALLFLLVGLLFASHAIIEFTGLGEELYSMTALVATLLLGFTMVIIDITMRMLGVQS